ncbi:MAG TPA: RNA pseudouridine synthase, partial [Prevotella sp.]|nr:RNA pseudouridine synthase [Prevotella sp.]
MNNPFYYEPDALCRLAIAQLAAYLRGDKEQTFAKDAVDANFQAEIAQGKMFGVVIVRKDGKLGYIAGYSGQIAGRSDWPDFVPAVYDYLQPNGYFKTHEAEITNINNRIRDMEQGQDLRDAHRQLEAVKARQEQAVQDFKANHPSGARVGESQEAYIRRRQFENAELHCLRKDYRAQVEQAL